MNNEEIRKHLSGMFATWLATRREREKPLAVDRKDAEALSGQVTEMFDYQLQFGFGGNKGTKSEAGKAVLAKLGK